MQRSDGGGSFQAVDMLNGKLLCGCDDVHACAVRFYLLLVFQCMALVHGFRFLAVRKSQTVKKDLMDPVFVFV